MAKNKRLDHGVHLPSINVPVGTKSGDPVVLGTPGANALLGFASSDRDDLGQATVELDGSWLVNTKGTDGTSNVAIALWDKIYYTAADNPQFSKRVAGTLAGYAMTALASGATGQVEVLLLK
jgi:hypothetical protein